MTAPRTPRTLESPLGIYNSHFKEAAWALPLHSHSSQQEGGRGRYIYVFSLKTEPSGTRTQSFCVGAYSRGHLVPRKQGSITLISDGHVSSLEFEAQMQGRVRAGETI